MKRTICAAMSALAGTVLLLPAAGLAANVCSEGVGIPPFLSSGAKPNLLMVLDNSGSMLDAAYSKTGSFCFDDGYDAAKFYGGYFQNDKWYQWSTANPTGANGPYPPWEKGKAYSVGNRVYANGIIWEVAPNGAGTSGCSSASAACDSIDEDSNVDWVKIFSIPKWKNAKAYTIGDIVWSGPQLFKATKTATSNDPSATNGLKLEDDTGVTWESIDSTWMPGKAYAAKSIVTYKGILYETVSGGTSTASAAGLDKDTGVTWKRLDEGSFMQTDESSARTVCSGATGTKHSHPHLCVTVDTTKTPNQVTAFAAKGSMLNWIMSSKFDVEKKILTGGKHDYYDKFLISEHRGCSGSRLIKQLQLSPVAPATVGKFLSLGMRSAKHSDAPQYEDRIDTTDDTGRLEVLAVTDAGYKMSQKCQDAITTIITHGLNGAQNDIDQCIATFNAPSGSIAANTRPTLNNSLQVCWQDDPTTSAFEITNGLWNSLIGDCKTLYTGTKQPGTNFTPSRAFIPAELRPPDGGPYLCYGVYDQDLDHINRVGYMGRCWNNAGSGGMATCNPWKLADCTATASPKCLSSCSGTCYWKYDTGGNPVNDTTQKTYKTEGGQIYYCGKNSCNGANAWDLVYKSSAGPVYVGDDTCGGSTGGTTGADWEATTWPNSPTASPAPNCILEAIKDYCDALKVPEVIDPSGSAGKSGETGNAPALLRDSELMAFLGGKDPMATMKGRIQQADRPKGIVHNVAQDLRLGVMSFRYVGAKSECDMATTTSKLEKYCPQNNKDGAQLLTPLEVGDYVKATNDTTYPANGNKRRHVDELAEAVNGIRGTSWTPLAEALYGAVGYYSQNANFCLNKDSSNNCLDFPVCKNFDSTARKCLDVPKVSDPVQYWCQDNHIIVITEGESTADANVAVKNFTTTPSTHFIEKLSADNVAGDGDNAGMQYCVNGGITGTPGDLYGSAYLDNMTWWGQHVKPLYRTRYVKDPDGNLVEKQNISTHVVTTGALTSGTATGECNPATLMTQAAMNGGTGKAPDYYYPGENPQQLEDNLYAVLDDILSRSSAGSAASVISSSRSGSGAVYQAVFWPKHEDPTKENKVSWIGDVHALLVSSDGLMYEDSDQNGKLIPDEDVNRNGTLDTGEDKNGNGTLDTGTGTDRRVIFYFSNKVNRTRGCYTTLVQATADDGSVIFQCPDDATYVETECPGNANGCVEIQDIKYLWSATKQLGKLAYGDTGSKFLKNRKIFTWNDANNNGMVDTAQGEWFSLSDMDLSKWKSLNTLATNSGTRGPVTRDFIAPDEWSNFITQTNDSTKTVAENAEINETNALNALTGWILGTDQLNDETTTDSNGNGRLDKKLRPRMFKFKGETMAKEWRLGDIIHSTPIAVSNPAESYHLIYRDPTYASFAARWKKRRTVVYFGGNDGLLHATNGGFYSETGNQFCCTAELDTNGNCVDSPIDGCGGTHPVLGKAAQLGDELWSYLPYNLQPHMKCLADRFYAHKYYVDQKPRIFDAQIFTEEAACKGAAPNGLTSEGCIHPGGWGTILVGSMRFGGSKIAATDLNGNTADKREFTSSFFILDITNPEAEPKLLGELTRTKETDSAGDKYVDLNYTTSSPTMIIMRTGPANQAASKWYLVMGNGPAEQDGSNASTKQALLGILPLEWLQGGLDFSGGGGRPSQNYNTSTSPKREIRLENKMPGQSGYSLEGGRFLVPYNNGMPGFISDMISVDYNIDDSNVNDQLGVRYRTDAIYFGTVDGAAFEDYHASHPNYLPDAEAQFYWNGGGRLFRMVTKEGAIDGNGEFQETNSIPSQWKTRWPASGETESVGPVRLLADLKMPMVAGPSIGYDGYNYWIYAGTGRFFSDYDKTDDGWCLDGSLDCAKRSKISFFGIKEPLKDTHPLSSFADAGWYPANDDKVTCKNPVMTWGKIHWNINQDVMGGAKNNNLLRPDNQPGKRGLMQTDDILAVSTDETNPYRAYDNNGKLLPYLACYEQCSTYPYCQAIACVSNPGNSNPCENPSLKCFPGADTATNKMQGITSAQKIGIREPGKDVSNNAKEYYTFQRLKEYIAGRCDFDGSISGVGRTTGIDGWYRDFHDARERNLGTSALLGGLLTFTTYQPFNDKCKAEGESSLYGIHFQTGTPWVKSVFGTFTIDSAGKRVLYKKTGGTYVMEKLSLGRGLSTTPSLHVGTGAQAAKAFVQTSTGEIIEVDQQELPITNQKSGRQNWTDRCGSND